MNQKVKVRCLSINPEHAVDESVPQNLTIGKVYDGWDLEVDCITFGKSVYITDDAGEESAMFGDEFEVVTEPE